MQQVGAGFFNDDGCSSDLHAKGRRWVSFIGASGDAEAHYDHYHPTHNLSACAEDVERIRV